MPVNVLIIRALLNYYAYYGDDFKVECPTGSGKLMTLFEVSLVSCPGAHIEHIHAQRRRQASGLWWL